MSKHYIWIEMSLPEVEPAAEYLDLATEVVAKYNGTFIIRAGDVEVLHGTIGEYPIKVLIEFPSKEDAVACYDSPEYAALKPMRDQVIEGNYMVVEGLC